jgi:isopenicillin N synthase-like dioxygenase
MSLNNPFFFQGSSDYVIEPYPQYLLSEAKKKVAEKYLLKRK